MPKAPCPPQAEVAEGRRWKSPAAGSDEQDFTNHITEGIRQMNQIINDMRGKYLDGTASPKQDPEA